MAVIAGVVLGLAGGRVERDGVGTILAMLALTVAATQLAWIWWPRERRPPSAGRHDRPGKSR
jgi:hypothetical protein